MLAEKSLQNLCQEAHNNIGDTKKKARDKLTKNVHETFPFYFGWSIAPVIYEMFSVQYGQNPIIQQSLKMCFSPACSFSLSLSVSVLHRYRLCILLTFCSSPDGHSVPEISRSVTSYCGSASLALAIELQL